MRHRNDSHVDEWAALVGEEVGDRAVTESTLWGSESAVPSGYRDEPHTDR